MFLQKKPYVQLTYIVDQNYQIHVIKFFLNKCYLKQKKIRVYIKMNDDLLYSNRFVQKPDVDEADTARQIQRRRNNFSD